MSALPVKYKTYLTAFEGMLEAYCARLTCPRGLADAMRYSLLAGGKRLRPVLFLAALDAFGGEWERESELALALECIHTYSLIHDDLPAMDNDDLRRGKPSSHKQFGEGNAILAGDALLSEAFTLSVAAAKDEPHRRAAELLAHAAGAGGMVAGQFLDLACERNENAGEEELCFIYENKTAQLIRAPLMMAAAIAGMNEAPMKEFGTALGVLFQMTDDILDVKGEGGKMGKTLGKDERENKLTCVRVYGLSEAERRADALADRCREALSKADADMSFFWDLVTYVRERDH